MIGAVRERSPQAIDGEKVTRNQHHQRKASWRQRQQNWCATELEHCGIVDDPATSPANTYRQLGQVWTASRLDAVIHRLNASLRVAPIPSSTRNTLADKRRHVEWLRPGDTEPYVVCCCEAGAMPEYSVMECREDVTPFLGSHMDLDTPPFFRVRKPGRDLVRGWRTVLIRLVLAGATTSTAVEDLVGVSSRASWQQHLGKASNGLPF